MLLLAVLGSCLVLLLALWTPRVATPDGQVVSLIGASGEYTALLVGGERIELGELAFLEEPDLLETWREWDEFRELVDRLNTAAASDAPLALERPDGSHLPLVRAPRSLAVLPWTFWLQLVSALFCWVAAELAFRVGKRDLSLIGYRLAGWGVAFSTWGSALYTTRSLGVDARLFEIAHFFNSIPGALLFGAGITLLLLTQPRRLPRPVPLAFSGLLVGLVLWLVRAEAAGPSLVVYGVVGFYCVAILVLLIVQRLLLRRDPIAHAIWRWQALAVLGGVGFFVVAQGIPALLGLPPLASQAVTLLGFAVLFVLMSLGATKYNLFAVSRWWGRAWLWLLAGALVLALDLGLASVLPRSSEAPMMISLLLVGWLYFPVRQWLLRRLRGDGAGSWAADVAELARASGPAAHLLTLERILHRRFQPVQMTVEEGGSGARLTDQGKGLVVPWPTADKSFRLELKKGGAALFDDRDVVEVRALLEVARGLLDGQAAYAEGERAERERVRRDLHDHLGARLSRLAADCRGSHLEENVKLIIDDVRHVSSVLIGEETRAVDVLFELEAEARLIARSFGLTLEVARPDEDPPDDWLINASERADLLAAVRECLTNAARHGASGAPVRLALEISPGSFTVQVDNERGAPRTDRAGLSLGFGLKNLERRAQLRGGAFSTTSSDEHFSSVFSISLASSGTRAPRKRKLSPFEQVEP